MKKEKNIKKLWLSIGSVALATLPITSVISCSSGGAGNNDNSSSDNGNNNGSGSGGSTDNKPTVEQKYLSHSNRFEDLDSLRKWDVLLNFDQAKKDILNNKIKWFEEDGTAVKYQVKITLEPGIVATTQNWNDVDLGAPFDATLNKYSEPTNWYKTIDEQVDVVYQFWKKENNQSYTDNDFEIQSITEDFLEAKDKPGYAFISLPLDKNIAVVDVLNEDIDEVLSAYCLGFEIMGDSITFYRENLEDDWKNVKSHFSPIDTANNKLVVNGLKNSTLKSNAGHFYYKFASGNVTISKV